MFDIRPLSSDECIENWSDLSCYLNKALSHSRGEWTTNDILKNVLVSPNVYHVWEVTNNSGNVVAIASTRIVRYNHFDALHIIALTSVGNDEMDEWEDYAVEALNAVKSKAKEAGLDRIEFAGRKGWLKKLKSLGWKEQYITMDYFLGEENAK